jgi:hypothetical protein
LAEVFPRYLAQFAYSPKGIKDRRALLHTQSKRAQMPFRATAVSSVVHVSPADIGSARIFYRIHGARVVITAVLDLRHDPTTIKRRLDL